MRSKTFNAKVQFQLPINAIHALLIPAKATHIAQVQEAQAKAPVLLVVRQMHQPVGDAFIFIR